MSKNIFSDVKFANLKGLSTFSYPKGIGKPDQYAKRAIELGHTGISITDKNHMASFYSLMTTYNNDGIKSM